MSEISAYPASQGALVSVATAYLVGRKMQESGIGMAALADPARLRELSALRLAGAMSFVRYVDATEL